MTKILTTTIVGLLITSMIMSSSMWAWADDGTKTPIKHVVVIFQENISYDHYFGTYPNALGFTPKSHTPSSNNYISHPSLLTSNPNLFNPFLLSNALTCDMDHEYLPEQEAYDGGLVDKFVQFTTNTGAGCNPNGSFVMGYYDGQNATAQWNIAQNFAMSDNSFDTTFGPSTPGALNLVSGQTFGATEDAVGGGAAISDTDPTYDDCSSTAFPTIAMSGKNIGDILNDKGITWGWFQGGFAPSTPWTPGHPAQCKAKTTSILLGPGQTAYSAHHEPFEYYNSTANPHHLPPASLAEIGHNGQANHQYDLSAFWTAISSGNLPQVSFIKAPKAEDGHAGYSDPIDEGHFLANFTNTLENSPYWSDTAVFILWDDSDGWYDHVFPPIVNHSNDPLNDYAPTCGNNNPHNLGLGDANDRCGHGPRLPFLVISSYAKSNYISHKVTDQTSPIKFIEDNWHTGGIPDTLTQDSYDQVAGSVNDMFDFDNHGSTTKVCFNLGSPTAYTPGTVGTVVPPVSGKCPTGP
jgi:phospholipase C